MPTDATYPHPSLSRRQLFERVGSAAAAACFGMAAAPASAQKQTLAQNSGSEAGCSSVIPRKSDKDAARHVGTNNSYRRCGNCRFFLAPDQCVVVEGRTTEDSSCALWAQRGGSINCVPDGAMRL